MPNSLLSQLVEMQGIETNYIDAWGKPAEISVASQHKLLNVLGYHTADEASLSQQLAEESHSAWLQPLNPVYVIRSDDTFNIDMRFPIELVNDQFTLHVSLENEGELQQDFLPVDEELVDVAHFDGQEYQAYIVNWKASLPLGYHTLSLLSGNDKDVVATARIIVAPAACQIPEYIEQGEKSWGLSVQLYCLRSEHNWGIGDFADLKSLVTEAGKRGADFIGLNPIHSLYPSNPDACSPYGPSSRRWINHFYLDVSAIEGYDAQSVQEIVTSDLFQQQLAEARAVEYIDYELVANLKEQALKAVFEEYYTRHLSKNSKQNRLFKAFVKEGGESLHTLAVFQAMQAQLKLGGKPHWGWPVFPKKWQDINSPEVIKFAKNHSKEVKYYQFLQWQCALQLEEVQQVALASGMRIGLYRDLAVGVSEGSAEIWGNQSLYCTRASVGAPPDILGPLGQNWGLPPMSPKALYEQQYQPIIDLFAANMKSAGALRIDHVMALLRLWWVVKGDHARDGGYVYYPVDDLLAILALESHRNNNLVIGEDLGTVPDEIRQKLADNGIFSYRVFFFEQAEDGGFFSPAHYPVQSMATLTTHDMPTLIGYWHCLDFELGKQLGIYPDQDVLNTLYADRHAAKQAILDSLHGHQSVSDDVGYDVNQTGMSEALNYGMQTHMAKGSSALLSLQLEDWLQMDKPVNIPGTFDEYPNWRRKLSHNLSDIFSQPKIEQLAQKLTEQRRNAQSN